MPNTNPYTNTMNREYICRLYPELSRISAEDWHNIADNDIGDYCDEHSYPTEAWGKRESVAPYLLGAADADRGILVFKLLHIIKHDNPTREETFVGVYGFDRALWAPDYMAMWAGMPNPDVG